MSEFEVKTYPVIIERHPDADLLELARIGDYYSIVLKGQFQTGDTCAYIPEASIVPDSLIAKMGLEGKLAGREHNRVRAIKLRGILSQGLVYPMPDHPQGMDVAEILGITKWEPPIPTNMSGQVEHRLGHTLKFPIENIKKYPKMFQEGEDVIITEKIHGTWCCMGRAGGEPLVSSLGMSEKGLGLKRNDANRNNLYVRQWELYRRILERMGNELGDADFHILGEIYGAKVQDLKYGLNTQGFRVFDIAIDGKYQSWEYVNSHGWETAPALYQGPYSKETVISLTDGPSTLPGADHIREGVVIRPALEAISELTGTRKIAKSISETYLLRRGGTELR